MKILAEGTLLDGGKELVFFCPGCKYYHSFTIERAIQPVWAWNGSMEKPTFSPSLLVNGSTEQRCHSFVTDGRIQYLGDSWHELRGQTVDMQELDW